MELESLISKFLQSHNKIREIRKRIPAVQEKICHQVCQVLLYKASDVHDEIELQKFLSQLSTDDLLRKAVYEQIDLLANNAKTIGTALVEQEETLYPPADKEYLSACQQLFYAIRLSGKISRPYLNYRQSGFYSDIVHEYEMQVWRFICKKVVEFDADKSGITNNSSNSDFMAWLNGCSRNLFLKAHDNYKKISPNLPLIENNVNDDNDYTNMPDSKPGFSLSEKIINLIKQDDTGVFKSEHIRDNTKVNFRAVVLLLHDGYKMKNIANQFDVPPQTLFTFYKRCINRYRSYIKDNI